MALVKVEFQSSRGFPFQVTEFADQIPSHVLGLGVSNNCRSFVGFEAAGDARMEAVRQPRVEIRHCKYKATTGDFQFCLQ